MKKKSFLLLSVGLVMFAACNNEPKKEGPDQAQVDSMVNARVDKMQNDMTAKNDSIIAAQAKAKADSMEIVLKADSMAKAMNAANKAANAPKKATNTHKGHTTAPAPAQPAAPVNPKDARFGNDAAKQQQQQQNTDKKAERFK